MLALPCMSCIESGLIFEGAHLQVLLKVIHELQGLPDLRCSPAIRHHQLAGICICSYDTPCPASQCLRTPTSCEASFSKHKSARIMSNALVYYEEWKLVLLKNFYCCWGVSGESLTDPPQAGH